MVEEGVVEGGTEVEAVAGAATGVVRFVAGELAVGIGEEGGSVLATPGDVDDDWVWPDEAGAGVGMWWEEVGRWGRVAETEEGVAVPATPAVAVAAAAAVAVVPADGAEKDEEDRGGGADGVVDKVMEEEEEVGTKHDAGVANGAMDVGVGLRSGFEGLRVPGLGTIPAEPTPMLFITLLLFITPPGVWADG